jgi:hypothetical protein
MDVPTIEQQGGSAVGSSGTAQVTATDQGQQASSGPSVTLSFSNGSDVTLDVEDLQVYLAAIQTLLLLYVTYKEVTAQ